MFFSNKRRTCLRPLAMILCIILLLLCSACGVKEAKAPVVSAPPVVIEANEKLVAHEGTCATNFSGGDGSEANPYLISSAEELRYLSALCNSGVGAELSTQVERDAYRKAHYCLTADISLNDVADISTWTKKAPETCWVPVESFGGVFDGNNHTITGMYIYSVSTPGMKNGVEALGLFGDTASGATIKDITLDKSVINIVGYAGDAGGIVGRAYNTEIINCVSGAEIHVTCANYLGGVVGSQISGGTLSDCVFNGQIILEKPDAQIQYPGIIAGGIGGRINVPISGCISKGSISSNLAPGEADKLFYKVGGVICEFAAVQGAVMENCRNEMDIELDGVQVGGVIEQLSIGVDLNYVPKEGIQVRDSSAVIRNCVNSGDIRVTESEDFQPVGGVIGYVFNSDSRVTDLRIENCLNSGDVSGTGFVGGVIGELSNGFAQTTLIDCENSGKINGTSPVGGVVGRCNGCKNATLLENCTNSGEVIAENAYCGGILGQYFAFNLNTADPAPLTIRTCTNTGRVYGDHGIGGVGGIVGRADMDKDGNRVEIFACLNAGEVAAGSTTRAGGILGMSTMKLGNCLVSDCANTGVIRQGDGMHNLAVIPEISPLTEEEIENLSPVVEAVLVLGGSAAGGIVGYGQLTMIENCVNTGSIQIDSASSVLSEHTALAHAATNSEDSEGTSLFAGAICGYYVYLQEKPYNTETCGIRDCYYTKSVALPFCCLSEEGIGNVQLVTDEQANSVIGANNQ